MNPILTHRAVLYAHDMEPITVLQLSDAAHNHLGSHGQVTIPVMGPVQLFRIDESPSAQFRTVRITAEVLRKGDKKHMMLFTHDEESALLLKSAFLPGQQRAVQDREARAFGLGFLDALNRLGT